ncbi:MAG: hypothetical protein HGB20_09580 [Chlorobiaceae bacterium]|nr:hypothetical protein [Chlorobiaceae bacterium]
MFEDVISEVLKAVETSKHWAESGWPATFGPRNIAVNTLKDAEALPRNSLIRLEAQNYWKQVQLAGADTSEWGMKALDALKRGDVKSAGDALYFSQYIEKPFSECSKTWLPLYESFAERYMKN